MIGVLFNGLIEVTPIQLAQKFDSPHGHECPYTPMEKHAFFGRIHPMKGSIADASGLARWHRQ